MHRELIILYLTEAAKIIIAANITHIHVKPAEYI